MKYVACQMIERLGGSDKRWSQIAQNDYGYIGPDERKRIRILERHQIKKNEQLFGIWIYAKNFKKSDNAELRKQKLHLIWAVIVEYLKNQALSKFSILKDGRSFLVLFTPQEKKPTLYAFETVKGEHLNKWSLSCTTSLEFDFQQNMTFKADDLVNDMSKLFEVVPGFKKQVSTPEPSKTKLNTQSINQLKLTNEDLNYQQDNFKNSMDMNLTIGKMDNKINLGDIKQYDHKILGSTLSKKQTKPSKLQQTFGEVKSVEDKISQKSYDQKDVKILLLTQQLQFYKQKYEELMQIVRPLFGQLPPTISMQMMNQPLYPQNQIIEPPQRFGQPNIIPMEYYSRRQDNQNQRTISMSRSEVVLGGYRDQYSISQKAQSQANISNLQMKQQYLMTPMEKIKTSNKVPATSNIRTNLYPELSPAEDSFAKQHKYQSPKFTQQKLIINNKHEEINNSLYDQNQIINQSANFCYSFNSNKEGIKNIKQQEKSQPDKMETPKIVHVTKPVKKVQIEIQKKQQQIKKPTEQKKQESGFKKPEPIFKKELKYNDFSQSIASQSDNIGFRINQQYLKQGQPKIPLKSKQSDSDSDDKQMQAYGHYKKR